VAGRGVCGAAAWGGWDVCALGWEAAQVMYNASFVKEMVDAAKHYAMGGADLEGVRVDWKALKAKRDAYILRLNGIYATLLDKSGVRKYSGTATFVGPRRVRIAETGEEVEGTHVLIATGGTPRVLDMPGKEFVKTSDDFFALEEQPRHVAIFGGGYIATELAGVFKGLGTQVTLFTRGDLMSMYDADIRKELHDAMVKCGIRVHCNTVISSVERTSSSPDQFRVNFRPTGAVVDEGGPGACGGDPADTTCASDTSNVAEGFDAVFMAVGRAPNTARLGLEHVGLAPTPIGHIRVNEWSETSVPNVYAVGDVVGRVDLTPVAIAAGRLLADRLFAGRSREDSRMDYRSVPTVTFSHPPIGTVGLSEQAAVSEFGKDNVTVFKSKFVNMFYSVFDVAADDKPKTFMKLVCAGPERRVVGLHIIGMGADEILQGFAVAIKMGATKADFDQCVAIHPTSAEEVVTMAPWGGAPPFK
jgi:glutathione reductase (NADPH)